MLWFSDSECYICGQKGHLKKDCPSGNSGKECYNCRQKGHLSRDCPEADSRGDDYKSESACYKCGKEGHFARDCGLKCYRCGKTGHFARDCEQDNTICYKCNKAGHFARDCSFESQTCYSCGKPGHLKRDCTERNDDERVICYNCNETGHYARDCPQNDEWGHESYSYYGAYSILTFDFRESLMTVSVGFVKIILSDVYLKYKHLQVLPFNVIIIKGLSRQFSKVDVALYWFATV